MVKKSVYDLFEEDFDRLCEKYVHDIEDGNKIRRICNEIIDNYC